MTSKIRFVIVGGSATVIDFGLLNLIGLLGAPTLVANTISTGVAMVFSFFLNKKFTLKSKSRNYRREVLLFVIFTLFGLWVIQNLIIAGILAILPNNIPEFWAKNGAKVVATIASMIWNFVMYDRVVFRKESGGAK